MRIKPTWAEEPYIAKHSALFFHNQSEVHSALGSIGTINQLCCVIDHEGPSNLSQPGAVCGTLFSPHLSQQTTSLCFTVILTFSHSWSLLFS